MSEQLLEAYFRRLLEVRQSRAGVKEESYYDALSNLLNDVGKVLRPRVRCVLQLANRGAGRPDGGLFTEDQTKQADQEKPLLGQAPARGAIEVKPTSDDAWVVADTKQVSDYWRLYRQVLVTNYRDFVLVGQDQDGNPVKLETYRLAESEEAFWSQAAHSRVFAQRHAAAFTEFLHRVMLYAAPLATPKDVAWFLASYARTAMARIKGHDLPALTSVRSALEEALGLKFVGEKGDHFFRSTFIQTLFYGVFSAWVLWAKGRPEQSKDRFDWRTAVWHLRVPMIQALFSSVATPASLGPLGLVEVLDWTGSVLDRVSRKDFFAAFEEGRAVQYFYEPFLEAFDPDLRKDLGVWYTPPEIVQYMVARVDTVLREELGLCDGLADPNVYVLDPCWGTGSFLVEVLRRIHQTLETKQRDALVGADVKAAATSRVFGFEILPAPFVVAHLQLGLLLQNLGAPLAEVNHERAGVYLTNALTGWEPLDSEKEKAFQALLTGFPELVEERDSAREVKREKPILVILGNPPYNAFAGTSPAEEQGLVEPYKQGLKEWGITKNYLDDLYVRFFRLAERRIAEQTGQGVVSYISNFSYLGHQSFVVMRQRFLSQFDRLWFDSMNGDSRETGKRTPDGKPDPSVFSTEYNKAGIRVGTAVSVLVRKHERDAQPVVRYREFWGVTKRGDLLESLKAADLNDKYLFVNPVQNNRYSFRSSNVSLQYQDWPRVADLCSVLPMLGLNENRGGALQDIDRDRLVHRVKRYFDKRVTWEDLALLQTGLTRNAAGFESQAVRKKVQDTEEYELSRVVRYIRRPFDVGYAYISDVSPLWNRSRPELRGHHRTGARSLLTRPVSASSPEGVPFMITKLLGEQDSIRGHAYYFPLFLDQRVLLSSKEPPKSQIHLFPNQEGHVIQQIANISLLARHYLASLAITDPDANVKAASLIWMHALAIGYSPAYLEENRDEIRQDWPHIPLPKAREALEASAALGEQVAALLDTEKDVLGVTAGDPRAELRVIASVTREGGGQLKPEDLALTAGWGHRGQNDVVMPGRGRVIERDYTREEQDAIRRGVDVLGLSHKEAFERLGDRTCDVYLNDVAYWRNVPKGVWGFVIGGYQVMKKWLSYREHAILGRPLTVEEAREVTYMVRRLAALRLLEPALDANYQQVKANTYPWSGLSEERSP